MRVLVTGSRTWDDRESVAKVMKFVVDEYGYPITVVHGNAKGADRHAHRWALDQRALGRAVIAEAHPADWSRDGRRAGPIRNEHMVKLGADLCVAFIRDASRGATHCAELAERSGIETLRLLWEDR